MRVALALVGLASVVALASPGAERFDHEAHKVHAECASCHGEALLVAPERSVCHDCHGPEAAPSAGGRDCVLCHEPSVRPGSHTLGWLQEHGDQVRLIRPGCKECHATSECVDCHERRGAVSTTPHLPGWGAIHGLQARLDPQSCVTCHAGDSCTACHEGGRAAW